MSSKIQKRTNSFMRNSVCRAVIQSFIRSVSHLCSGTWQAWDAECYNSIRERCLRHTTRASLHQCQSKHFTVIFGAATEWQRNSKVIHAAVFVLQLRFLRSHIGIHANSFFLLRSKNERQKPKREEESSFPVSVRCRQKAISLEPFVRRRRMVSDSQPSNKFVSQKRDNNGYAAVKVSVGPFRPTWSEPNRQ